MSDNTTTEPNTPSPTPPPQTEGFEDMVLRRFGEFEQFVSHVHGFINRAQPLLSVLEESAAATVPGAAPVINAVTELQSIVTDIIGAVDGHFGPGKIGLPAAPTQSVTPSAAAG